MHGLDTSGTHLSASPSAGYLQQLRAIVPAAFEGGELDFGVLGELLGVRADAPSEKFGLSWNGKWDARRLALEPTAQTLRPMLEESLEWDATRNLMIEGDNLEVLKSLHKSYAGSVKLIYIDPPYNTGSDFVYSDSSALSDRAFREQSDEHGSGGEMLTSLADTSGRFHSSWLSMIYPRLLVARQMLTDDGVLLVSIDKNEAARLTVLCSEVFGEENHLATFTWVSNLKGRQIVSGGPAGTHEYILCFARNAELVPQFRGSGERLRAMMPSIYKGDGYTVKHDETGPYVTKNELYNTNSKFNEKTAPTMVFNIFANPDTGEVDVADVDDRAERPGFVLIEPHANARPDVQYHAWRWSRQKVLADTADLEFDFSRAKPRIYTKIRDVDGMALKDVILGPSTGTGQKDLEALGLARVFDTPKPVNLLRELVLATTGPQDTVLDFFAGSGSTAHAVIEANRIDGGQRSCISVQLDEPCASGSAAALAGYETIGQITRDRLRRVHEAEAGSSEVDTGFRAFRLDTSNITAWDPQAGGDLRESLLAQLERVKADRTELDVLYEILLKLGLELTTPIETREIAGTTVYSVGAGTLVVCVPAAIASGDVEAIAHGITAWVREDEPAGDTRIVFRDSAFVDDVAKSNMTAILEQHGFAPGNIRSL